MSNPHPQNDPSTTIGVGGVTSGQQGATPTHETQQETGGSGGDGLTRNQAGETLNAPDGTPASGRYVEADGSRSSTTIETPGSAVTATRSPRPATVLRA